jgi:hypothetical protein
MSRSFEAGEQLDQLVVSGLERPSALRNLSCDVVATASTHAEFMIGCLAPPGASDQRR